MAQLNTYLRVHLCGPLKAYCRDVQKTRGTVINDMLEKKLRKEGYLND